MRNFRAYLVAAMCLLAAFPADAAEGRLQLAQSKPAPPDLAVPAGGLTSQDASMLRRELNDVMKRYPPQLGQILRMDGTLMSNPTFMAPYPALQAFLTAHPEVAKNPAYYFEEFGINYYQPESPSQRLLQDTLGGAAGLTIFGTVVAVIVWIVRTLVDYRRWNRLARVQAEAHTKLLDRFTANDELIAYVQSPAGRQFLESAPIALDPGARRLGAPVSRILWSAQAGLVILMAGLAFQVVSKQVDADVSQPLAAIGVVGVFVAIGFMLSAVVSYGLSRHLKLFETLVSPTATPPRPEA